MSEAISKKVPQLRFPEFEGEWRHKNLGKVFSIFNGYAFSSGDATTAGVRWLKIADVGIQQMSMSGKSYLPENFTEKHSKFIVRKGDYVIALTRPILSGNLKIAQIDEAYHGALLNQRVGKLQTEENDTFVYYLLQNQRLIYDIENRIDGTDPPNFSPNEVNTINTFLPADSEQDKISIHLSAVDKKISLLKQKHEQLVQYKKGIMQQLFSQQLRFKDDNGQDFPDWSSTKFKQHFERITRKNSVDNQNVLTISGQHGLISQQKYFNKSVSAHDVTGYYLINKGEFAYNKSYSKGYPMGAIKRLNDYEKGVVSTLYICFRSKNGDDRFWEQYFEAGLLNREIHKIAQEGARNHGLLNVSVKEFFDDMKVESPCENEQKAIADFLEALDKKINLAQQQVEQTQAYKQGLLQQMFV